MTTIDTVRPPSTLERLRAVPDAAKLLTWYLATRVWAAIFIERAAGQQLPSIWTGPKSDYFDMAQLWDGQWYKIIAEQGYPSALPVDAAGAVQQNPWAIFPGFPFTVRPVMVLTGLPFSQSAVIVNVVLGGCAVYVVMKVLARVTSRRVGLWGAVLLCAVPSAPALQIAYSESLALLLLALCCWFLLERGYLWCAVCVVALSLTRPIIAPFALVVLTHLVVRWVQRRADPFPVGERLQVVGLGLLAAAGSLIWPVLVGVLVGDSHAYQRTQSAWRSGGVIQPFHQAMGIVHLLWGDRGPWYLLLGAMAYVALLLSPWGRQIGAELITWCLAYPFYLLAVTEPWTSTFRYLLMLFPLCAVIVLVLRSRWLVVAVAALGLWWQVHWIDDLLLFWPPTDYPP